MPERAVRTLADDRRQSTALPRSVRWLLVGVGCSALGSGLTLPYLLIYLHEARGLPITTAGFVLAWVGVVSLVVAPGGGWLIDHAGPRVMLVAGNVVEAAGVALIGGVTRAGQAYAVATVVAVGGAVIWPASSSLVATLVSERARQRAFGVQFVLLNLGLGVGGLVASMIVEVSHPASFVLLYRIDAVSYLGYIVVLLTLPGIGWRRAAHPAGVPPASGGGSTAGSPAGYRRVLADRAFVRLVLASVVMLVCGYAQIEVGFAAFATGVVGVAPKVVGWALAANTAAIVAGQMLVLRRLQGASRSRGLGVVSLLWATCWALVGVAGLIGPGGLGIGLLIAALVVFGLGETVWSPLMPALVNVLATDDVRGRYNAVSSMVWQVAGVIGPVAAGLLIGGGLASVWIAVTVGGSLVGGVLAVRLRRVLTPFQDGRAPAPPARAAEGARMSP
ncbi:MAG: MFS transporter [Actinomycetes bacterium]